MFKSFHIFNLTNVFALPSILSINFFLDRKAVSTHLPLASTRSTPQDKEKLLSMLEEFALKFKPS